MSVKPPKKGILDTNTPILTAGQEMLYDKELPKSIKKKYKEKELTESERLLRSQDGSRLDF